MRMPCSPKTMLKIGVAIAIPLVVGFIAFPQFRPVILAYAPLALFALCPLSMLFMGNMMGDKKGDSCSSCGHEHAKAEHIKSDKS